MEAEEYRRQNQIRDDRTFHEIHRGRDRIGSHGPCGFGRSARSIVLFGERDT